MSRFSNEFERFIRRVHRRYILLRLLERAGIGILCSCGAGFMLVVIAMWRGTPASSLAAASIAVGAAAGLLYGWVTRPTLHQTALEADRQLDNSDLLSTALSFRTADDPWTGAVRAAADSWSKRTAPSAVILNRLGARAWGGVGLAAALLVVLAMLPTYANPTQAADRADKQVAASDSAFLQQTLANASGRTRTPLQHDPEDAGSNGAGRDEAAIDPKPSSPNAANHADRQTTSTDPSGRGSSESHSQAKPGKLPDPSEASAKGEVGTSGRAASGVGVSAQSASPDASTSGQKAAGSAALLPVPPWKSGQWPEDVDRARRAVESGQVPDQYRDVIHGYFDRN